MNREGSPAGTLVIGVPQERKVGLLEEKLEHQPDLRAYHRRTRTGPCFVCAIVAGDPAFPGHPIVYEDEKTIAFLTTNPTQYGYSLVCPKEHRGQATGFRNGGVPRFQRSFTGWRRRCVGGGGREDVMMTLGSSRAIPTSTGTWCPYPPVCPTRSSSSER